MLLLLALACTGDTDPTAPGDPGPLFPAPEDHPELWASGGPAADFGSAELFTGCAEIDGGPESFDTHNLIAPYRGYLVLPWASEWGQGGLSLFDMSEPCQPEKVADSFAANMRETHAIGFLHLPEGDEHEGDYAIVNGQKGVLVWDLADPTAPVELSELRIDEVWWPDAYARVAFSVFWQYPYIYLAAADNGVYVIDSTDPTDLQVLSHVPFDPVFRAGGVFVMGTEMLLISAEQTEAALLDVSDPTDPQLHPGGRFTIRSGDGEPREAYSGNMVGPHALFARKDAGGGAIVYDITDPTAPTFVGEYHEEDAGGGYIFAHEGILFVGNSNSGDVYDATEPANITKVGRGDLPGDLDTVVPFGNVAVFSVDDEAEEQVASLVMPWREAADTRGPRVGRTVPADGAVGVATTARIGIGFDEFVEPITVHAGALRVSDEDGLPVAGWGSAQETIAHWSPKEPLEPMTTYTVEVMEGGIEDVSGNPVDETVSFTFTTGAE